MEYSLIHNQIISDFNQKLKTKHRQVTMTELRNKFIEVVEHYKRNRDVYTAYDAGMHEAIHKMFGPKLIEDLCVEYVKLYRSGAMRYNLMLVGSIV